MIGSLTSSLHAYVYLFVNQVIHCFNENENENAVDAKMNCTVIALFLSMIISGPQSDNSLIYTCYL